MGSSFTLEQSDFPHSRGTGLSGELSSEGCSALGKEKSEREIRFHLLQGFYSRAQSPKATTGLTGAGQTGNIYIFTWDTPQIQGKLGLGGAIWAIGAAVMPRLGDAAAYGEHPL